MVRNNKRLGRQARLQEQVEMRAQEEKDWQEKPTDNPKWMDPMAACGDSADPAEVQQIIRTVFANCGRDCGASERRRLQQWGPMEQGKGDLLDTFQRMLDFQQGSNFPKNIMEDSLSQAFPL